MRSAWSKLQDRHAGSYRWFMSGHVPSYVGWQLPTRHRRRCQTTAFCRHSNTGRRSHTKLFWRQNIYFAAAAPRLWNSLPSDIRQPDMSYGLFRRSLKTFLFGQKEGKETGCAPPETKSWLRHWGPKLLLVANRKSHTRFRLLPKSTTLDDTEEPLCSLFQNPFVTFCFAPVCLELWCLAFEAWLLLNL